MVNGAQDMGGMQCMGPVVKEENEPVFHGDWEKRVLALTLAMAAFGRWNIDMSRFAREDAPAADYLSRGYYQTWLYGLEKLLAQHDFLDPGEIQTALKGGRAMRVGEPALTVDKVGPVLAKGFSTRIDEDIRPRFKAGDAVRAGNRHPRGHTRVPRYVRGRAGVIAEDHGVFIFPDTNAVDGTQKPQHVYSVRFTAAELWGAATRGAVYVDLWDDYLEHKEPGP